MFKYTDYISYTELLEMSEFNYAFTQEFLKPEELEYFSLVSIYKVYKRQDNLIKAMEMEINYINHKVMNSLTAKKLIKGFMGCLSTLTF